MPSPTPLLQLALAAGLLTGLGGATAPVTRGEAPPTRLTTIEEARPLVLVVHGRGQLGRDTAVLRREAYHSLARGIARLDSGVVLREDDVRLVWYADVLARPDEARCDRKAAPRVINDALGIVALAAGALLDGVAGDEANLDANLDVLELRGLAGDLRYVGDAITRCAAERRLEAALTRAAAERRPVILVAHSLGGLVAWGHLSARDDGEGAPVIRRFVTVGSLVGAPDVRRLVFGEREGRRTLPRAVRSWVNVVNADDPLAARVLGTGGGVSEVTTEEIDGDPHELTGYLRDGATARAVLAAWREEDSTPRP